MIIRLLGLTDYVECLHAMQSFTLDRNQDTEDEIWLTEHEPVYTKGIRDTSSHVIRQNDIPLIQTDRGGLITYHGPGQIILYPLINLKKNNIKPTQLVSKLENIVINTLHSLNVTAYANPEARGVYVNNQKIASIGLRVKKHCSYHGMSFNVAMDLTPFSDIHPCGMPLQEMTHVKHQISSWDAEQFFFHYFQSILQAFALSSSSIHIKNSFQNLQSPQGWPSKSPSFS